MAEQAEQLAVGAAAEVTHVVTESDTALAMRSGDVEVLATPRVLALLEAASVAVTRGRLEAGQTSVGMRVQLDHVQPTRVGATVFAHASLERIEGRRLTFAVRLCERDTVVAEGRVVRVVVDTDRFLDRLP